LPEITFERPRIIPGGVLRDKAVDAEKNEAYSQK
jgi:hypothetical protein